jgi:hypothetical protein
VWIVGKSQCNFEYGFERLYTRFSEPFMAKLTRSEIRCESVFRDLDAARATRRVTLAYRDFQLLLRTDQQSSTQEQKRNFNNGFND